jgi:NADH:ubiquinone oxidoreductase subunit F (NADH-binding)
VQLVKLIDRIAVSKGSQEDVNKLLKISDVMRDTSFCPLGQSLYLPISSSLKYFRDEIDARIQ